MEPRRAEIVRNVGGGDRLYGVFGRTGFSRDPRGDLAQHRADLALEVPHARFARVVGDDAPDGGVLEHHRVRRQPVLLELPRQQIPAGDVQLLVFAVAGQRDDLHPIEQRRVHRPELIRRGDEQDA